MLTYFYTPIIVNCIVYIDLSDFKTSFESREVRIKIERSTSIYDYCT